VFEGNPSNRPLNVSEPTPEMGAPAMPKWLSARARTHWRWAVRQLDKMGILTKADRDVVANYCNTFARWRECEEFIRQHGISYPIREQPGQRLQRSLFEPGDAPPLGGGDRPVRCWIPYPEVAEARHLLTSLRALQQELGLTPSARSRIHVPTTQLPASDEEAFFGKPAPARRGQRPGA
jgi:P27 family predicted phage terminase small subunit